MIELELAVASRIATWGYRDLLLPASAARFDPPGTLGTRQANLAEPRHVRSGQANGISIRQRTPPGARA